MCPLTNTNGSYFEMASFFLENSPVQKLPLMRLFMAQKIISYCLSFYTEAVINSFWLQGPALILYAMSPF